MIKALADGDSIVCLKVPESNQRGTGRWLDWQMWLGELDDSLIFGANAPALPPVIVICCRLSRTPNYDLLPLINFPKTNQNFPSIESSW